MESVTNSVVRAMNIPDSQGDTLVVKMLADNERFS